MKYLVTDPCYIMTNEQWDEYGENYGWDTDRWEVPIPIKGGKITKISTTKNGDGSTRISGQLVGVDSGTVCLAEVDDDFDTSNPFHGSLGAVTGDKELSQRYFRRAKTI